MGGTPLSPTFRVIQPGYSSRLFCRVGVRLTLALVLFLMITHFFIPNIPQYTIDALHPSSLCRQRKLHFLLPASSPDINLSKAFVSSSILGYPIPVIINWGSKTSSDGPDVIDNPNSPTRRARQIEKIYAVAHYLDSLRDAHKDDLVLMTDSLDTWFQLPPSVLLSRYSALNTRAHEVISARLGPAAAKKAKQSIVFSAEKKCWPRRPEDMGCWAVPESSLETDFYGPSTDHQVEGEDPFRFVRPRYLNSGFMIGPVREARVFFKRAARLAHADPEVFGADQGIIAQIFGEQEYMRERRRTSRNESSSAGVRKRERVADFRPGWIKNYEFGIGLDYEGALGLPTAHTEKDMAWISMSDSEELEKTIQTFGITEPRARRGLQEDVAGLPPPFDGLSDSLLAEAKLKSWNDVPLYTNLWNGVAPVAIHLNRLDALEQKVMREESWWRMWFAPFARQLFDVQVAMLEKSLSKDHLVAKHEGNDFFGTIPVEVVREWGYGAETIDKNGRKGWIRWDELCDENCRVEIFETRTRQRVWDDKRLIPE